MLKKAFLILALIIVVLLVWNLQLIMYGIGQGIGQIRILINARPIEEVMNDPQVELEIKKKLDLVKEIKAFSISELGLKDTRNYATLYDQKGVPVLWVVRACEPFRLVNKEWKFPIVGTVSYKGYFELAKAKRLRDELKGEGYDTYIREVNAWSTLGWFRDPIMSGTLKGSDGSIANTIIHELTHATIFVKDSLTYNENLASFIGDKGAREFVIYAYGDDSQELEIYDATKSDTKKYANHFLRGAQVLDSLYQTFQSNDSQDKKLAQKEKMIKRIISNLDTVTFVNTAIKERFKEELPNNAYFMSYLLYRSEQEDLDSLLQNKFGGVLRSMVESLKLDYPQK